MQNIIEFFRECMFQCTFVKYFGIECFGCGFQRSFLFLLKGDFLSSIKMYPALIPTLVVLVYTVLHLKFHFKIGHVWILRLSIFSVLTMIINYFNKFV